MATRKLNAAGGLAALALLGLVACAPGAHSAGDGPWFARLGPPDAPVKLFYEEEGSGPAVLLIHGFGASTYTWRGIAPELAQDHRVIAVDLKGFGQSDKPFDTRYSVFDQAELLAQLIVDRDLRDLTLVGHSFGGGVALVLSLSDDERLKGRITKLVLLDTIAYPQDIPVFFRMLDMPLFSHVGVRMVPPAMQTRIALRIAYLDNSKIDDEEVETYAAPLRTAAGKHAIIHSARQIMPEGLDEISERYRSIEMPTLIVWCDHDRVVPLDVGLKLRRTLPNSTLKLVEGCGHMPQEEQPAATLDLIRGFLGR
jgi:pimeloyl-ACP methyl ester carboxylesterase